jgi:hypothetical protein
MGAARCCDCRIATWPPNARNQVEMRVDTAAGSWFTEVLVNGKVLADVL